MRLAIAASLLMLTPMTSAGAAERPIAFSAAPAQGGTLVVPLRNADHLGHAASVLDAASREAVARVLDRFVRDFRQVPAPSEAGAI